jgi:hypothetical protein
MLAFLIPGRTKYFLKNTKHKKSHPSKMAFTLTNIFYSPATFGVAAE